MNKVSGLIGATLVSAAAMVVSDVSTPHGSTQVGLAAADTVAGAAVVPGDAAPGSAASVIETRWQTDVTAMSTFRPGYSFWQHIFTIPDGSIAFGSAIDGRLLAVFPTAGDWEREGGWTDPALATTLAGQQLPTEPGERRDWVAALLEESVGPVLHNPTRGHFLLPNAQRYGRFLDEWAAIYQRFAVPAEVGLAQAIIESGLNGTRRSEANAVGFCQWLDRNWTYLNRIAPNVIEPQNQTTQAAYCAAYLTILATKHGSFIPALSEHHTGGTNVGRTLINGERLGGTDVRERYFLGADLARDLRNISPDDYSEVYRTYGPRSYRYAEMVFGNTFNVRHLTAATPQRKIYAMRVQRALPITEIARRTGLSADEIRRFNPALVKKVPAGANLYLPVYVPVFGRDVSFWHRSPSSAYRSALDAFVRLDAGVERWDDPSYEPVLRDFGRRFTATNTEEGTIMATVLAYVIDEAYTSGRGEILSEFRTSDEIRRLFDRGVEERNLAKFD